jgi:serine/threonine protein kinase
MDPLALVGRTLAGKYLVGDVIGEGGMGIVYEAQNALVGRRVALKVLAAELASAPEHLERFKREARAAAAIGHPNIIDIYDFGQDGRVVFFVMERLDGMPLERLLELERRLSVPNAVNIAGQTLDALGAAHDVGIVHRDIKPDNIFVCRKSLGAWEERHSGASGRVVVKVLDFGISMFHGAVGAPGKTGGTPIRLVKLTKTGAILGTAWYMSPEQAAGNRAVDHRTDIWAVGAVLFEMLAGRPPFEGATAVEVLYRVLKETPRPVHRLNRRVPRALSDVIGRALAKDPSDRFPNTESFARALEPFAERVDSPPTRNQDGPTVPFGTEAAPTGSPIARTFTPAATQGVRAALSPRPSLAVRVRAMLRSPRLPEVAGAISAILVGIAVVVIIIGRSSGSAQRGPTPIVAPAASADAERLPVTASPTASPKVNLAPPPEPSRLPVELTQAPPAADAGITAVQAMPDAATFDVVGAPSPQVVPMRTADVPSVSVTASLAITGTDGAVVLLDGRRVGVVPTTIDVPADGQTHNVYASKPGYSSRRWPVGPFDPGASIRLEASLAANLLASVRQPDAGTAPPPAIDTGAPTAARDAGSGVIRGPAGTVIRTTRRDAGR